MKSDAAGGQLDLVLLATLVDGPCHGYRIITALKERSGEVFDLQEGTVYPALHRLEDVGLVTSAWNVVDGRRRRVYRLTPNGKKALSVQRNDWNRFADAINAVLASVSPTPGGRVVGGPA